ncbi:hypothetical protein ACFIJ5_04295 [Haloimpatiens sp. FM7330]|uniref:hypothetical protein n=1 Tax=Haloimpatiens sp. FM7330 TaxID=3298610 RepID=UPI003628F4F0
MKILDIRSGKEKIYKPIQEVNNKIICEQIKRIGYKFPEHRVFDYYVYDNKTKGLRKLRKNNDRIQYGTVYNKNIEGENCIYYLTKKRNIIYDEYDVYKIDLDTEKESKIFKFKIENKYSEVKIEVLTDNYICAFAKEPINWENEIEIDNFEDSQYGYSCGYLFEIDTKNAYEINDQSLLKGVKDVFFKTNFGSEECIIYEENYIETWEKEQEYEMFVKYKKYHESQMHKFFYKDSLKVIPLKKFIEQVKNGVLNLEFYELATRGYEGYELFYGVDRENIYCILKDFDKMNEEKVVFINRDTLKRKVFTITDETEFDEITGDILNNTRFSYSFENKYKGVFAQKLRNNNVTKVKEVMNGQIEYSYPVDLGLTKECLEDRYLVTYNQYSIYEPYTNIIDMKNNKVKKYKAFFKIIGDKVILF